ncbi:hypothetical protein ABE67_12060 [Cytobacillus firmus]|uniref:SEC-C domain-containing protein n=1 Tax=Cytobacillus firmus TaxID=1399 RepID=UPI0018CDB0EB|nr:SEC-C domain-containing protein [Cytobacillus firmus]MBG9450045.1 hypothetical protein [Cytobacillus firmus]
MVILNALGKQNKIGPYEECPCGSNKKFKFCCYQKARQAKTETDNKYLEYSDGRLQHEMNNIWESTDFKECFAFDKENCNGVIKSAHSIQNNRILNKISDNGHVYSISHKITKQGIVPELKKISKNKASTFFGFCDYHDTELFKPIELNDYQNEPIQNFLFAFRAFAIEYHKKVRKLENARNIFRMNPATLLMDDSIFFYRISQLDVKDNEVEYNLFLNDYQTSNYNNIVTFFRRLDYGVKFAVSTSFVVKDDLNDMQINDIYSDKDEPLPSIYLNVYPIDGGTNIIISYHKNYESIYKDYFEQINELNNEDLTSYLNFLIIEYTENVFFNPNYIMNLSEKEKESLLRSFQSSIFVLDKFDLSEEENYFKFNLFS